MTLSDRMLAALIFLAISFPTGAAVSLFLETVLPMLIPAAGFIVCCVFCAMDLHLSRLEAKKEGPMVFGEIMECYSVPAPTEDIPIVPLRKINAQS